MKYRKRPIIVEAEQFFYDKPMIKGVFYPPTSEDGETYIGDAYVVTIHGQKAYLQNGDWVIQEPDGEHFYPCKDEVFCSSYQPLNDEMELSKAHSIAMNTLKKFEDDWNDYREAQSLIEAGEDELSMTKKKPEPTTITGLSGETYTITVTERGLRIELDDRHRLVYTSILTGRGHIRFEVEPVKGKRR